MHLEEMNKFLDTHNLQKQNQESILKTKQIGITSNEIEAVMQSFSMKKKSKTTWIYQ
jgi:hypothetical protein